MIRVGLYIDTIGEVDLPKDLHVIDSVRGVYISLAAEKKRPGYSIFKLPLANGCSCNLLKKLRTSEASHIQHNNIVIIYSGSPHNVPSLLFVDSKILL